MSQKKLPGRVLNSREKFVIIIKLKIKPLKHKNES